MHHNPVFIMFMFSIHMYLMFSVAVHFCICSTPVCRSVAFALSFGSGAVWYCFCRCFSISSDTYMAAHNVHIQMCFYLALLCVAVMLIKYFV